jgi:hypothetical protein
MKRSKIDYRGAAALRLTTRVLELDVTTGVGPRITALRSRRRPEAGNLFLSIPEPESRLNGYLLRGGHRLWHSPEEPVRTYQPDDAPLAVRELPRGVSLRQPVESATAVVKGMQVEFTGPGTIQVTHTLTNRGAWAIETAPWALTMLRPGGFGVIPLLPKGDHAGGDLLPSYSLVPWTYTDFSGPEWKFHRDFIGIDVAAARGPQKLGLTNYPGWSAYWSEGLTFVKHAAVQTGATYPDFGCVAEFFTNGAMIELETLGVLTRLAPGRTVRHVERWTVFEDLPRPDNDGAFAQLARAVARWRREI